MLDMIAHAKKLHAQGHTGKGIKVAILETLIGTHHLIVAWIIKQILPDCEIRYFKISNPETAIRAILDWGADLCNMSFHGWDPDRVKDFIDKYRDTRMDKYNELYELYNRFFNEVTCFIASANDGLVQKDIHDESAYKFPAGSEIWQDEISAIGALTDWNGIQKANYSNAHNRLDFGANGSVNIPKGEYIEDVDGSIVSVPSGNQAGTSIATPFMTGAGGLLVSQLDELKGKPRMIIRLLRNQAIDVLDEGYDISSGYGVVVPRLIMVKKITVKFTDGESGFTVNGDFHEVKGVKDGVVTRFLNYVRNGKTSGPIFDITKAIMSEAKGCYIPEDIDEQMENDKEWTSNTGTINAIVKY